MLPVINRHCVEQAVKTGLGLDAEINLYSVFDRKNYFYPDLPAGYQISQYQQPVVGRGRVMLDMPDGSTREIGITRLHLEQDAGKSLHDQHPTPDLCRSQPRRHRADGDRLRARSAQRRGGRRSICASCARSCAISAPATATWRRARCAATATSRCAGPGEPYGTRCEIKNVNSVRFVMQAIEYEARRQIELIEEGGTVEQQTRLFDSGRGVTRPMRSKEHAHDYRYFPDPDLLPLELDPDWVERLRAELPELPDAKKARFVAEYGLSAGRRRRAGRRARDGGVFRGRSPTGRDAEAGGELGHRRSVRRAEPARASASSSRRSQPEQLGALIDLIADGTISGRIAKDVFAEMVETGADAGRDRRGARGCARSPTPARSRPRSMPRSPPTRRRSRNTATNPKVLGFFVGQVMKATQRQGQPGAGQRAAAQEAGRLGRAWRQQRENCRNHVRYSRQEQRGSGERQGTGVSRISLLVPEPSLFAREKSLFRHAGIPCRRRATPCNCAGKPDSPAAPVPPEAENSLPAGNSPLRSVEIRGALPAVTRRAMVAPSLRQGTRMIHHVSIPAREPQRVATVLAELMNGKCFPFGPLEGAYMAASGDEHGTMIEVYPEQATLEVPANDDQVVFGKQAAPQRLAVSCAGLGAAEPRGGRADRRARGLARQDLRPRHARAEAVFPCHRVLGRKPADDRDRAARHGARVPGVPEKRPHRGHERPRSRCG